MSFKVEEMDAAGRLLSSYEYSTKNERVSVKRSLKRGTAIHTIRQQLFEAFLPNGYPASVTNDYTRYQIFDSLQAFSSSIAGLLASRAVLQGVGVGDSTASPTGALMLTIVQESTGRLATILFAHRLGAALEPECKKWRLAADVFNDAAMILDCLSPALERTPRVLLLSMSSALRALCGVAAGSAKASLSAHFARWDNLGELNAKDSSQETVISLMGMLAGSVAVGYVEGPWMTWICLIGLLAIHLGTNYAAVRAVSMDTFNRQRTGIVFSEMLDSGAVLTPQEVSRRERIFETEGALRWRNSPILARARIGVTFGYLVDLYRSSSDMAIEYADGPAATLDELLKVFTAEEYILWYSHSANEAAIVVKEGASTAAQLKGWVHAILMVRTLRLKGYTSLKPPPLNGPNSSLQLLQTALRTLNNSWDASLESIKQGGWDVESACLETSAGVRVLFRD